jgi:hypothetical protein
MMLFPDEVADLRELVSLLDKAHDLYFQLNPDGPYKSGDGHVLISLGNYFQRKIESPASDVSVTIHSSVFSGKHHFGSTRNALLHVRGWHQSLENQSNEEA